MQKTNKILILLCALMVVPAAAFAGYDIEYLTYGGFKILSETLRKIALIFSDPNYKMMFGAMTALSFAAASFKAVGEGFMKGGRIQWGAAFASLLAGVLVYAGVFGQTGTLHLYDEVSNEYTAIGDLPAGMLVVASVTNKVEHGLIEMIDKTSIEGETYADAVGGIGFSTVKLLAEQNLASSGLSMSTASYMEKCVGMETALPDAKISANQLLDSTDLLATLEAAASPAVYMSWFDSETGEEIVDCQTGYNKMVSAWNDPATIENAIKTACKEATFNEDSLQAYNRCRDILTYSTEQVFGSGATPEKLTVQAGITDTFYQVAREGDVVLTATLEGNQQAAASMFGAGVVANEWIPILKNVLTCIAFALTPFILLFLPTTIFGRALSLMVGLFVWLTAWGVTDALTHSLALDLAGDTFARLREDFSAQSLLAYPSAHTKALNAFGFIRSSSALVATVITGALFKFAGSHAMAMLAGSIGGVVQSAGQAAGQMTTHEGTAQELSRQQGAMNAQAMYSSARMDTTGARQFAHNSTANSFASNAEGGAYDSFDHAASMGMIRGQMGVGRTTQDQVNANTLTGGNVREMGARSNGTPTIATDEGKLSSTITPGGEIAESSLETGHGQNIKSGDINDRTTTVATASLGAHKATVDSSIDRAISQRGAELSSAQEAAGKRYNEAQTLNHEKTVALNNTLDNSEGGSSKEATSYRQAQQEAEIARATAIDAVSKTFGVDHKTAEEFYNKQSLKASLSTPGESFGWFSAEAAAEFGRSGNSTYSASDAEKLDETFQNAQETQNTATTALDNLHDVSQEKGWKEIEAATDGVRDALSNQQTLGQDYNKTITASNNFEEAVNEIQSNKASFTEDIANLVQEDIGNERFAALAADQSAKGHEYLGKLVNASADKIAGNILNERTGSITERLEAAKEGAGSNAADLATAREQAGQVDLEGQYKNQQTGHALKKADMTAERPSYEETSENLTNQYNTATSKPTGVEKEVAAGQREIQANVERRAGAAEPNPIKSTANSLSGPPDTEYDPDEYGQD